MRLLHAHIRGFGRITDRALDLSHGLQLVVGPNETGKSTLQQFLLAMLFGLKLEGRRRREYLPQYERFRPWSGAPYAGELVYELASGERFEIHRCFERERESLQVLDAITGRDRTQEYVMDARKERAFMQDQLQLTRQLFEATTALGQLAGRPNAAGVLALRERVQGLLDSGEEGVSAQRAVEHLGRLRDQLGSDRTPTRGIGLCMRQRRALQVEHDSARLRHAEILELCAQRANAIVAHARAERAWAQRHAQDRDRERLEIEKRVHRAEQLTARWLASGQTIAAFADVATVDAAALIPAREHVLTIRTLEHEAGELTRRIEQFEPAEARLGEVEIELGAALNNFDAGRLHVLQGEAERLRELVGRAREARQRHAEEQAYNRDVIARLRRHHGRDWIQEEFMARLPSEAAAAQTDAQQLQAEAASARQGYRRRRRGFVASALLATLAWTAVLAGALLGTLHLPVAARVAVPVATLMLLLLPVPRLLGRLVDSRDRMRALDAQAARVQRVQGEARTWLDEVLRRNGVTAVEEIYAARRDYETLRAQAEHGAWQSKSREVAQGEKQLQALAQVLRAELQGCELERVAALCREPPAVARALLPYMESPGPLPAGPEADELARVVVELAGLSVLRRGVEWLGRVRTERERAVQELSELGAQRDTRQAALAETQLALEHILHQNGAPSFDVLVQRLERQREREAACREQNALERERAAVLGGESLEALRARLQAFEAELALEAPIGACQTTLLLPHAPLAAGADPGAEGVDIPSSFEALGKRVEQLAAVRAQLEERLVAREREGRTPAEIELELRELDERLRDERERDAALVLARDTLESVTRELHRAVAPRMNARVAEIFARLSCGAHTEVRLDEDLTPRVRVNGGTHVQVESLSGGAGDQLYFALRVTAGEQLSSGGERLPLLLDDPFVQYDRERLRAGLELVAELALDHQIVLFTCEESQADALQALAATRGIQAHMLRLP